MINYLINGSTVYDAALANDNHLVEIRHSFGRRLEERNNHGSVLDSTDASAKLGNVIRCSGFEDRSTVRFAPN